MPSDDPTPRELLIQLQNLAAQVASLITRIDSLTGTYVPRGEFDESRRADRTRMEAIERVQEKNAATLRTILTGVSVGIVMAVVGAVIALAQRGAGL